jgi:hypothetical protein
LAAERGRLDVVKYLKERRWWGDLWMWLVSVVGG